MMRERLFKLLGALLLAGSLVLGWVWMEYRSFTNTPLKTGDTVQFLVVEPGSHLRGLARQLSRRELIDHPGYFEWMARLHGLEHAVKAGEYEIKPGTTPRGLLQQIAEGKVIEYALTVVEGWTFQQMLEAVRRNDYLKQTLKATSGPGIMAELGLSGEHPEGLFLPETYYFPRGTSDAELLRRAYRAMQERLAAEWEARAAGLPIETPYEALTLASIIEKETAVPDERTTIAGVFVRRLERGMRLQTDPTVIYGIGDDYDGNIRRTDLRKDTPYNTYVHKGLPPTPIALPGADSLHAALHPKDGDALYFVSRGDGSHHFSSTLEEHNKAVIKYQLNGKPRRFSSNP